MTISSVSNDPMTVVLPHIDDQGLGRALRRAGRACVEAGTEDFIEHIDGILVLGLTTASAFSTDAGTILADLLIERGLIDEARRSDLRLALHEALANGLLHGNLELHSHNAQTPAAFLENAALLESRLASPDYARRPIAIAISLNPSFVEIAITDSGKGYSPEFLSAPPSDRSAGDRVGHGLMLLARHSDGLRFEAGGRRVILSFQRCARRG